jgi:toxoflavin biosynthesis protein ToxD
MSLDASTERDRAPAPVVNPNELGERAAMGLPEHFVDRLETDEVAAECRRLAESNPDTLARLAEDPCVEQRTRLAAGVLLALVGDPRIDVYRPAMIAVPAARVTLGLPPERVGPVVERWRDVGVVPEWIEKETPQYEVDIEAFRIGRYPVTNLEYREFLRENPQVPMPSSWRFGVYPANLANHPVWTVRPEDADAYAAWLARRTRRAFRLPTEAEWEYAASGGDGREFPWGSTFRPEAANTVEQGPLFTTPVGIHPLGRSPFGADDMAGNVEEYVADNYRPYPGGAAVADDLLASAGSYRVARGGSFTRYGDLARCTRRHGWYPKPVYAMGFRLAESL